MKVAIKRLAHASELPLPAYATEGAAGMDLLAAIESEIVVAPGAIEAVPTGIALALPNGFEAQVRPRSGLAARHGITVTNAPGTIDEDYRGEIKVLLVNLGDEPYTLESGERVAQLVVAPVTRVSILEVEELDETPRGAGGFGSTGR